MVGDRDVTTRLNSILQNLSVTLNAGDEGDTASISLDDSNAQIAFPTVGDVMTVSLGWADAGMRDVFKGTIDDVRSSCSRHSGMMLNVSAKGFDSRGGAKSGKRRHWDNATVQTILQDAGGDAKIATVKVDPELAKITLKYWAMTDDSFLAMGQRLAQRIGGQFAIQGDVAVMSRKGAAYAPSITASWGENVQSWDVAPILGRGIFGKVICEFYDQKVGKWDKVEVSTGLTSDAVFKVTPPGSDKDDAQRQADARAAAIKASAGGGVVVIEGQPDAIPGGACVLSGLRQGVDGTYRIKSVTHSLSREGFVTSLQIENPDVPQESEQTGSQGD